MITNNFLLIKNETEMQFKRKEGVSARNVFMLKEYLVTGVGGEEKVTFGR